MLCLADNTLHSLVLDAQLLVWPRTYTHTHANAQIYNAYVRKVFVININITGVVTVKCFGQKELGVV